MKMKIYKFNVLAAVCAVVMMSSCASSYQAIYPQGLHYVANEHTEDISLSYRYNVLQEGGNKKYAKKEAKKGMELVAIKITNHTDRSLSFQDDIQLFAGTQHAYPMSPKLAHQQLKQNAPIYLLYLLMSPLQLYTSNGNGTVSSFPIGLILGPGIAGINVATAASANKNFLSELQEMDLSQRTIGPGETVHGLIALSNTGYAPLRAKVITKSLSNRPF